AVVESYLRRNVLVIRILHNSFSLSRRGSGPVALRADISWTSTLQFVPGVSDNHQGACGNPTDTDPSLLRRAAFLIENVSICGSRNTVPAIRKETPCFRRF